MHSSSQVMATCPFNAAHKFAKQKFVFHISRCKDRQKVQHLYTKCQYNPLHFVLKQDIQLHECCCLARRESIELLERLKKTFRQSMRQPRERSRQRNGNRIELKDQEGMEDEKVLKFQDCDSLTLEECEQCQGVLRKHKQQILNGNDEKLKRFILKYYQLAIE